MIADVGFLSRLSIQAHVKQADRGTSVCHNRPTEQRYSKELHVTLFPRGIWPTKSYFSCLLKFRSDHVCVDTLVSNTVHVCYLQLSFTQWPATQNAIERRSCSSVLERSIPFNWTQPDDPDAGTGHESKNAPRKFSKSQSNGEFAAQHS